MNNRFQQASEVEEIQYEGTPNKHWRKTRLTNEGLTTPGTTFTSPWTDTNRSPDSCLVNTVTQKALTAVNAKIHLDLTPTNVLTQAMSPADTVDSWLASTPAGASRSSTSRPNTRDTALTSLAGDPNQLPIQNAGDESFDPATLELSTEQPLTDSYLDEQNELLATQMNASTGLSGSSAPIQSKHPTSHLGARDPFFDSVPKGPSQLRTSRWNARAPTFDPWTSTRDQAPAPSRNTTETPFDPGWYPLSPHQNVGSDRLQQKEFGTIPAHICHCGYQMDRQAVTAFEVHHR